MKTTNWIAIGILSSIVICLGLIGVIVYFNKFYIFSTAFTIFLFTLSATFLINRKRISLPMQKRAPIYSIVFVIVGVLILASSIFGLGDSIFVQKMSIQEQLNFYRVLRPEQVSFGFMESGMGILLCWGSFANFKDNVLSEANDGARKHKILYLFTLHAGIFCFVVGIYLVIHGLYP